MLDCIYYTDAPLAHTALGLVDLAYIADILITIAEQDPAIKEVALMAHSSPLTKPCQTFIYYDSFSNGGPTGPHIGIKPLHFCHHSSHHQAFADRLALTKLSK